MIAKNLKKEWKNVKRGKKIKNWEGKAKIIKGSFTLPHLTHKAVYAKY